jgi:putative effector of murein hydrolase
MIPLFVAAIVLAILSAQITRVSARGGMDRSTIIRALLGSAMVIVAFSLFVWGFVSLSWYWPIVAFLLGSIVGGFSVTRSTWPHLYLAQPIIELLVIGIGCLLWIAYWPF